MNDKTYSIVYHKFIMKERNPRSSSHISYEHITMIPTINLELGWESKTNQPFVSNMLISTQSDDFAVVKIIDNKSPSLDCRIKNICLNYDSSKQIKFSQKIDGSFKYYIQSNSSISTLLAIDKKPDIPDFFKSNKGSIRLIELNGNTTFDNWPFFAGVIG